MQDLGNSILKWENLKGNVLSVFGTPDSLQYSQLENYTLNLNAHKCKERSGEKDDEK